jgi:hypothetical protein
MSERPKPPTLKEEDHPTIDEMLEQDILPNSYGMTEAYNSGITIFEKQDDGTNIFVGYKADYHTYLEKWLSQKAGSPLHEQENK